MESPTAFVVEHAHYADQASWGVLCDLCGIPSLALGVITMDTIEDLEMHDQKSASSHNRDIFSASEEVTIPLAKLKMAHRRMLQFETTTVVQMNDYSILEVEQLVCSALNVDECPAGLAAMVHQLSGGSPYWCREMAMFIQSTGRRRRSVVIGQHTHNTTTQHTPPPAHPVSTLSPTLLSRPINLTLPYYHARST